MKRRALSLLVICLYFGNQVVMSLSMEVDDSGMQVQSVDQYMKPNYADVDLGAVAEISTAPRDEEKR